MADLKNENMDLMERVQRLEMEKVYLKLQGKNKPDRKWPKLVKVEYTARVIG